MVLNQTDNNILMFKCVRQCSCCKTKLEITENNLKMRKNGWTLRIKEEFFVVCPTCEKKVHVSKQYLTRHVMTYAKQNRHSEPPTIIMSKDVNFSQAIHCDNCGLDSVCNYDDVRLKRQKNYEIFTKPPVILYYKCPGGRLCS